MTAPTTSEKTRAEFIAEADAVCKRANAKAKEFNEHAQRAVSAGTTDEERLQRLAPILRDGYAWQRQALREFAALEPPPDDREVIDSYNAAAEEATALVGRLLDAAEAGDVARFASTARSRTA